MRCGGKFAPMNGRFSPMNGRFGDFRTMSGPGSEVPPAIRLLRHEPKAG